MIKVPVPLPLKGRSESESGPEVEKQQSIRRFPLKAASVRGGRQGESEPG